MPAHCCEDGECSDTPSDFPVWDDEDDFYYNCPSKFITPNVAAWYGELKYADRFGSNIEYRDRPARWLSALNMYDYYKGFWHDYKNPKKATQMDKLAATWQKK